MHNRCVRKLAAKVAERTAAGKQKPTLATVLVGDRPDSAAYVASKGKACQELGMGSISEHLPADATQEQVEALVKSLNADPRGERHSGATAHAVSY